jgi:hypothetical protein
MTATNRLLCVVNYKLNNVLKRSQSSEAWYLASSAPPAERKADLLTGLCGDEQAHPNARSHLQNKQLRWGIDDLKLRPIVQCTQQPRAVMNQAMH